MTQIRHDPAEQARRQPADDPAQAALTAGHAAAAHPAPLHGAAEQADADKAGRKPVGDKLDAKGGGFTPAWQQALQPRATEAAGSAAPADAGHSPVQIEARRQAQIDDSQRIADQLQSIERNRRV